jgi:DNA adenine methylase
VRAPHPIPYQGSKRRLAPRILAITAGRRFERLVEPFAGSAAIALAARSSGVASGCLIADSLRPLADLWQKIVHDPGTVADAYEQLWTAGAAGSEGHFVRVRTAFNEDGDPAKLLYLLARCVKNAPRFNANGRFNQSADRRRTGTHPRRMRQELVRASTLLAGAARVACADFEATASEARRNDLVYLDPPWEGTSSGPDRRYHAPLPRERLTPVVEQLSRRGVPWLLSYDGRHGDKRYGPPLPDDLGALRIELDAGRSAQATLHGRKVTTFESLYVSPRLIAGGEGAWLT